MTDSILSERRGSAAWLTLNRPQIHNAFDDALIAALTDTLAQADADPAVRAVVLSGNGSCFSAGADLNWMRGMAGASEQENREEHPHPPPAAEPPDEPGTERGEPQHAGDHEGHRQ